MHSFTQFSSVDLLSLRSYLVHSYREYVFIKKHYSNTVTSQKSKKKSQHLNGSWQEVGTILLYLSPYLSSVVFSCNVILSISYKTECIWQQKCGFFLLQWHSEAWRTVTWTAIFGDKSENKTFHALQRIRHIYLNSLKHNNRSFLGHVFQFYTILRLLCSFCIYSNFT